MVNLVYHFSRHTECWNLHQPAPSCQQCKTFHIRSLLERTCTCSCKTKVTLTLPTIIFYNIMIAKWCCPWSNRYKFSFYWVYTCFLMMSHVALQLKRYTTWTRLCVITDLRLLTRCWHLRTIEMLRHRQARCIAQWQVIQLFSPEWT